MSIQNWTRYNRNASTLSDFDKSSLLSDAKTLNRLNRVGNIEQAVIERNINPVITGSRILDSGLNLARGAVLTGIGLTYGTAKVIGQSIGALGAMSYNAYYQEDIASGKKERSTYADMQDIFSGYRIAAVGTTLLARTVLTGGALPVEQKSIEARALAKIGHTAEFAASMIVNKNTMLDVTGTFRNTYALKTQEDLARRPELAPDSTRFEKRYDSAIRVADQAIAATNQFFRSDVHTGSRVLDTTINVVGGAAMTGAGLVGGVLNTLGQTAYVGYKNTYAYIQNDASSRIGWSDYKQRIYDGFGQATFGAAVLAGSVRTASAPKEGLSLEGRTQTFFAETLPTWARSKTTEAHVFMAPHWEKGQEKFAQLSESSRSYLDRTFHGDFSPYESSWLNATLNTARGAAMLGAGSLWTVGAALAYPVYNTLSGLSVLATGQTLQERTGIHMWQQVARGYNVASQGADYLSAAMLGDKTRVSLTEADRPTLESLTQAHKMAEDLASKPSIERLKTLSFSVYSRSDDPLGLKSDSEKGYPETTSYFVDPARISSDEAKIRTEREDAMAFRDPKSDRTDSFHSEQEGEE